MLSDAHFLAVAHIVADAGTCSRLKVGAVLVKDRRIISTGYNGAPAGMTHCNHRAVHPDGTESEVGVSISGGCEWAVHAEVNAIAYAAKNGVSTDGSVLYTTDSPCTACAQLGINAGIREVRYGRRYRNPNGLWVLEQAGIKTEELGEPHLLLVSAVTGDGPSVHTREHADEAFERGWTERAASRRGGGSGI